MSPEKQKSGLFEFRVIAGTLKGRKIISPDMGITRPPLTRLRKAIFDFLAPHIADKDYLDLFSGTGSYLFEAVSRGARSATGVELHPLLAKAINGQAAELGVGQALRCLAQDVFAAIPALRAQGRRFDAIMIAPPQYKLIVNDTLKVLVEHPVLAPGGLILCQHDSSETKDLLTDPFAVAQQRRYGNTTFTILTDPGQP